MDKSILAVFSDECSGLKIDRALLKNLRMYVVWFMNKNADHVAFFGGNLAGVHVVRFMPADQDKWFNDILEADEQNLEERLLALPTVNEDWNVSSDTMNLSCAWLMHAIFESRLINDKEREEGMKDVALVLLFKFFTSRYARHFRYPADRRTAEAAYSMLSYKFDIKQLGSWSAYFNAKASDLVSEKSIHAKTIRKFDVDKDIVYLLNDTQGRIREMLKTIYGVFDEVHKQGIRINTQSSVIEHDGEELLRDKTKNIQIYMQYINSIVTDKNAFIKDELATVVEKLVHTMPPRLFRQSLEWMSSNYRQRGADEIEDILNETLIHGFEYFSDNKSYVRNTKDLPGLLGKLKGVYMSSRSTDPALLQLREKTEKVVRLATENKNSNTVAAIRTGVLLYIVLRSITMQHYAQATLTM